MKSIIVKEFKARGIKRIAGKKLELYSFYDLVGYYKRMIINNEEIK